MEKRGKKDRKIDREREREREREGENFTVCIYKEKSCISRKHTLSDI